VKKLRVFEKDEKGKEQQQATAVCFMLISWQIFNMDITNDSLLLEFFFMFDDSGQRLGIELVGNDNDGSYGLT